MAEKVWSNLDFQSASRITNLPAASSATEPLRRDDAITRLQTTALSATTPAAGDSIALISGVWTPTQRPQGLVDYINALGIPFIENGFGYLKNNTNFTTMTFDPTELKDGFGSFKSNTINAYQAPQLAQKLAVDTSQSLQLRLFMKAGNASGTEYNGANITYAGLIPYDSDGIVITPRNYTKFIGSTDTTLAAALNPGDTTITLTNATGWANASEPNYQHQFCWYPYTNSSGFTYPDYSYTRNLSGVGMWASGGISGNVITLTSPWAGAALASGTKVRNVTDGGTYLYTIAAGVSVPNAWTQYQGTISGVNSATEQLDTKYRPGTAYLGFIFLFNYHGGADNRMRVSAFSARYV